jgi:hypothetical protein
VREAGIMAMIAATELAIIPSLQMVDSTADKIMQTGLIMDGLLKAR